MTKLIAGGSGKDNMKKKKKSAEIYLEMITSTTP